MGIKVIVTGVTAMVGEGVLLECRGNSALVRQANPRDTYDDPLRFLAMRDQAAPRAALH
jgi:hypothetical protein